MNRAMKYKYYSYTECGNFKEKNEDFVYAASAKTALGNAFIGVVCDGMGGLNYGDYAGKTAGKAFCDWFNEELIYIRNNANIANVIYQALFQIAKQVNQELYNMGSQLCKQLGTTAAVLLIIDGKYFSFHIGDSRIYRISGNEISLLTTDHSLIMEKVIRGELSFEEAAASPQRNILTECIGATESIKVGFSFAEIAKDDYFLLTSDGLHGGLSAGELYYSVQAENNFKKFANKLVLNKREKGETDNISIIIVRLR